MKRFYHRLLVAAFVFIMAGLLFLLFSTGYFSIGTLWPLFVLFAGLVMLYLAFARGFAEGYLFLGMVVSLFGVFFFVLSSLDLLRNFLRFWPGVMLILGLSLIPLGLRKKGDSRIAFTVAGTSIIVLSIVFLVFSLDLVDLSFLRFVSTWWPLVLVLFGLILLVAYFVRSRQAQEPDDVPVAEDDFEENENGVATDGREGSEADGEIDGKK